MEVADVFVINKSDRDGAAELRHDLERLLAAGPKSEWRVPVVDTVASERRGTAELWAAIEAHRAYQERTGVLGARRQRFASLAVRALVDRSVRDRISAAMLEPDVVARMAALEAGECSLPEVCAMLLARL